MGKPHKFMWTGIDVQTSLDPAAIWAAVDGAVDQTRGKFTLAADEPMVRAYNIKSPGTIFTTAPELTFEIQVSDAAAGRRAVRTHIKAALLTDSSIPFGPKTMMGHKVYMKFGEALRAQLAHADLAATVTVREGPMPDGFALSALTTPLGPPA